MSKSEGPKGRVLTAKELELAEAMQTALLGKATAAGALEAYRKEIGKLTREIAKLSFTRATVVWGEIRDKTGSPKAPTCEQLTKGT